MVRELPEASARMRTDVGRLAALTLALTLGSAGAASATTWHDGDLTTFTEGDWGDIPNGSNTASLLENNYDTVYSSTMGLFEIGVPGATGFSTLFTGSSQLLAYFPAAGTPGPFDSDLLNPTSTAAGVFGGKVAALKLNVDFSDAGLVHGTASIPFGDLTRYNLTATPDLNNLTVRQALAALNAALGGLPTSDTFTDLNSVAQELNGAFFAGSPSQFAQDHLAAPVPEPTSALLLGSGIAGLVLIGQTRSG
jgi:hypothetical protein